MKPTIRSCERGVIAVITAMALPLLLGFGSLGVEVSHWYLAQRQMQGAADAAALSAAAQFIQDHGNKSSTAYRTVGAQYAEINGFTIPVANVCLIPASGADNCGTVRTLDSRPINCAAPPCIAVEITQNTFQWLTTQKSMQPDGLGRVRAIPTPVLVARAVVTVRTIASSSGTDCVLALANDPGAVLIHGNGDLRANCGVAIDGGRDQNVSGTAVGGITFNGGPSQLHVTNLIVAANSTNCPGSHCFLFNPSTSALPASAVFPNTATPDPYASQVAALFATAPPLGVKTGGVARVNQGSGYTNGPCIFTVTGGTYYDIATSSPAKFNATISGGKVTAIGAVTDPGAYTTFPTSPVSATSSCGGSGATFTLTEDCFTWNGTPIAGRKYCSINLQGAGTTNFPAGNYWIAGGDSGCVGFCVSSANATVTSAAAGVTFFLTNGKGTGTFGTNSYATVSIASGTVSLCAPGTNCGTTCTNNAGPASCMLFVQNPAAPTSTSDGNPSKTNNTFSGNGTRTLSGLIYLSKQTFAESGNGPIEGCVGIVAKYVDIGGTPTFSNGCLPGNGIGGSPGTVSAAWLSQ